MTLFFDRSVGKRVPESLRILRRMPRDIEHHQLWFPPNELDDVWLKNVGAWGWTVIGHDWSYHKYEAEISVIKQYRIGVFYLWGAESTDWEVLRCFVRAYDRIDLADKTTERPFIYSVSRSGHLYQRQIP